VVFGCFCFLLVQTAAHVIVSASTTKTVLAQQKGSHL
jgi:hypothetical protein